MGNTGNHRVASNCCTMAKAAKLQRCIGLWQQQRQLTLAVTVRFALTMAARLG